MEEDAKALLMPCDAELAIDIVLVPFFLKSFIIEKTSITALRRNDIDLSHPTSLK